MNNLKQTEVTDCDYNIPLSTNKTIFWDTFGSVAATPKYRNIPVCKTIDAIKVTGITIENASGVKELKHSSNFNKTNVSTTESILKKPKQSPNVAATKSSAIHRHQRDFASSSLGKQSSWSEPTLNSTKDRGDSVVFEDICQEEVRTLETDSKRCFPVGKLFLPKKKVVKGLLYIKNAGDIYKSEIEAKKLLVYEKDIFKCFPRLTRMSSTSKNLQTQIDEKGDFDLAIYLSGLVSAVETHQKQNTKDTGRTQQKESKIEEVRINKRKKSHISKSKVLQDETYKTSNQISISPEKLKKAKKCSTSRSSRCKTRLSYQINKPNAALEIVGDDSDEEYELNESGDIVSKRKTQENLTNDFGDAHEAVKPSDSGRLSCKSRKSGTSVLSSKTRIASQYSLTHYAHGHLKPKMNEEETWETFEMIFKSYASTSRHSGEVIPRKISTEWMMNAGIVNDILTQKQADDAFRSAAGAKITMNAQEYKEFLISLSLKLKLSYYEIYRRMCGM